MRDSNGDKLFYAINSLLLIFISFTCIMPLFNIIAVSLSSSQAIMSGKVTLWPVDFSVEAYSLLLSGTNIINAFKNSVVITVFGAIFSMTATILAAYPLSRKYLYARRSLTLAMVFTMLFGVSIIPTYLVVKNLGMINTYYALWLPGLISTYNMIVMKSYYENLPEELDEAARIDGCGEIRLLLQIILPLSLPMIATLSLFYGVHYWNMFMSPLIYLNDSAKYNLSVLVQEMIRSQSMVQELMALQPEDVSLITPEAVKTAGIIVMIVPMLTVYPFLQKYFVKGILIGSIKG